MTGTMTKVGGTMEVEIEVEGTLDQGVVEDMFTRAIASALNISTAHVLKLTASEIGKGSGSRRLASTQTVWYEVSYEVMVPSSMDPDAVVAKANRIAVPGSAESMAFR